MSATPLASHRRPGSVPTGFGHVLANSMLLVLPVVFTVFLVLGMLRQHVVAAEAETFHLTDRGLLDVEDRSQQVPRRSEPTRVGAVL